MRLSQLSNIENNSDFNQNDEIVEKKIMKETGEAFHK